ncbi:receptor-type tyrosine-protein phosphatase beta-like [Ptychodera flava]|uniref:receptor-type tyrosine-protein phosphatase beta-like n=1 Tax=Ptychodera flava TaxID=63121 RepID=UPI00396A4CE3
MICISEPNDVDTVTVQRSDSDPTTSLDVTWTTATGDFNGYRVVCSSDVDGENDHEIYASNTTTSHTFDGLEAGRLYTVSVYTVSGVDCVEDERVESNAVSENRRTKPNYVYVVVIERSDSDPTTSLDVTWTHTIGDYHGYRVVCSSGVSGEIDQEFSVDCTTTTYTFDGLVQGRLYTVSVYTVSGVDSAEDERVESNAVSENRRTKPYDVDTMTVQRSDNDPTTSLDVTWTHTIGDYHGYRVVCSSGVSGEDDQEFSADYTTTTYTFDGLVQGRLYTVSVYTVSGVDSAEDERVESNAVSENRRTKWYVQVVYLVNMIKNSLPIIQLTTYTFDGLVQGRLYTVSVYTVSGVDSAEDERVESNAVSENRRTIQGRLYTVSVYTVSGVDSVEDERVESNAVSENRRTKPYDVDTMTVQRSDNDPTTSLDVTWTQTIGDYHGYRVVCSSGVSGEDDREFSVDCTTTTYTFDGLVQGRLYTVSVYTVSGVDSAEDERVESNAVSENRRTKPYDVDTMTVQRSDNDPTTSLDVTWTQTIGDYHGYRVVCSSGVSGEDDREFSVDCTTTTYTFDGLVQGRLYTVSVYTVSGVDSAEDERVESNAVSENRRTKPNDVEIVVVERSDDDPTTSLIVTWTEVAGDFHGYRVVCSSGVSGEDDQEFSADYTTTTYTFDGLLQGRLYTVSVYTVSGVDSAEDERVESNAVSENRRTTGGCVLPNFPSNVLCYLGESEASCDDTSVAVSTHLGSSDRFSV